MRHPREPVSFAFSLLPGLRRTKKEPSECLNVLSSIFNLTSLVANSATDKMNLFSTPPLPPLCFSHWREPKVCTFTFFIFPESSDPFGSPQGRHGRLVSFIKSYRNKMQMETGGVRETWCVQSKYTRLFHNLLLVPDLAGQLLDYSPDTRLLNYRSWKQGIDLEV